MVPGEEQKYRLETFQVKVEDDQVYLQVPPIDILSNVLGSSKTIIQRDTIKAEIISMQEAPVCGTTGGCGDKSLEW